MILKVLITIKTCPIPSKKYDELVCTAGVTESGDFIRLYPINFRDLPFSQQYKKYQWIEVDAVKHVGIDSRKESFRPNCDGLKILGNPIPTKKGDWSERAKYVLLKKSDSIEELAKQQKKDKTSLGVFKPRKISELEITQDTPDWDTRFKTELRQRRLFETRTITLEPPRKVPFKFHYRFECEDSQCKGHRMMITDWEISEFYWKLVHAGKTSKDAANGVKERFLNVLCGKDKDTHFYVGTVLAHPKNWIILGIFWPKKNELKKRR